MQKALRNSLNKPSAEEVSSAAVEVETIFSVVEDETMASVLVSSMFSVVGIEEDSTVVVVPSDGSWRIGGFCVVRDRTSSKMERSSYWQ